MRLTPGQIFDVAMGAGFPADTAEKMVAIAMKESSGNTEAHNAKPPDDSYGLWQINMIGAVGVERLRQFGLPDKTALYDPATNARVAFALWNGSDANLDRHWAIVRSATNRARYEQFLPVAHAARNQFDLAQGRPTPGPPRKTQPVAGGPKKPKPGVKPA